MFFSFFFFFQAEDGIRDTSVTGVQTCALPICIDRRGGVRAMSRRLLLQYMHQQILAINRSDRHYPVPRSEERRVGKECRSRRSPDHEKKKKEKNRQRVVRKDIETKRERIRRNT